MRPFRKNSARSASRFHEPEVVRDEQHRDPAFFHLVEFFHAAVREDRVADRKSFVDDQDIRVDVDRGGECNRTYMPVEYSFTGRSRNSPMPANCSTAGKASSVSALRQMPMISLERKTFSRPGNSGLNRRRVRAMRRCDRW